MDSILKAPGSILEAPRLDLGGLGNDFFENLVFSAKQMQELISNLKVKLCRQTPTSNFGHDFPEGRVGGGGPPPGVFN